MGVQISDGLGWGGEGRGGEGSAKWEMEMEEGVLDTLLLRWWWW